MRTLTPCSTSGAKPNFSNVTGRNTAFPAVSPLEYAVKCSDYGALHDLLGAGAVAGAED